ncbi:alpha/beta hydrolase [Lewinella sp. IMCC34183]|uniref:alpha/beta hydrolase n=1 Tax=Lewinella sp. IMCC34183 TaxID=2248762 RepID=UPI000E223497|nr:alpha/beta hydrolase [Lewinella sp. IMCC34183]
MTREELEKTDTGRLASFEGRNNLLVSFGGIQQGLGMPVFEFFNSISDIPCDKIYLRDFHQAWYQKGVDAELDHVDQVTTYLRDTIREKNYDNVCFLGNSMGGYAAILFGTLLNVDTVISFAPQTFIGRFRRLLTFDRRWSGQLSDVYAYDRKRPEYFDLKEQLAAAAPYATRINLYYSPQHRLDRKHAERLRESANVTLHPVDEGGHAVVKVIRDRGELKSLIQNTFQQARKPGN